MDTFSTENRSTYEVDLERQRVRRLTNYDNRPPTPRQGDDGQWRTYVEMRPFPWPDGKISLVFVWEVDGNVERATRTGPVMMATRRVQDILDERALIEASNDIALRDAQW